MIEEFKGDFLQWLRGFYFTAKEGTLTQAASLMRREQPTISHQIKCLEQEFGIDLFDRSSGRLKLTPEGQAFLNKTISLFEAVHEMKGEFEKGILAKKGRIVIIATQAIVNCFLPRYIGEFRKSHPQVQFDIEGGSTRVIVERLESAEADFGIASIDSVPETMMHYDLFETELKLIAPKNNHFFKRVPPTLKEIAKAPLILFSSKGLTSPLVQEKFTKYSLESKAMVFRNNAFSVKKYVALGLGVSFLDGFTLSEEDEKTLDIFSLERYFPKRKFGLLLRKRKYLSPAVKAFIHTIKPDVLFSR